MQRIPKIIHYCWFGPHHIPRDLQRYITGWHRKLPDYKFTKWSEQNFNWQMHNFTKQAYLKHNWAFVSDYVRLYALYHYGGIYLDTDVEVLRSLDPLLHNQLFMGIEDWNSINTGLICGAESHESHLKDLLNIYDHIGHKNPHKITKYYNTVNIITNYFHKFGFKYQNKKQLIDGCHFYPTDYFCPKIYGTNYIKLDNHSYTIHHYTSSWINQGINKKILKHIKEANFIKKIVSPTLYRQLYKYYLYFKARYQKE